ncbi:MAG: LPXTG cell wall anchor domain-containing protein [Polyangiaceae bacterium]
MSSVHVSPAARALPFTGFAALPFFIIGGAISVIGAAMALFGRRRAPSKS